MRIMSLVLATFLISCPFVWSQNNQQQSNQQSRQGQPQNQQGAQNQRPTLGPATPPSLYGPHSFNTTDPHRLLRVRSVYVEPMDNFLSQALIKRLQEMHRFRIVSDQNQADSVLSGTCFNSRRLKLLHSEVFLADRRSGKSIWQDVVRLPYHPPGLRESVRETANVISAQLVKSINEAARR